MNAVGFVLAVAPILAGIIALAYNLIFWRTYEETWAWIHQRHRLTGDVRHIQKVCGVPMVPPAPPPGSPRPPLPRC